jgi:nucleoredoxin
MRTLLATLLFLPTIALASLEDLVGEKLINASGEDVATSSLDSKLYGLYFSAAWCPPCHFFTPKLVQFQEEHKDRFQVIFVSDDNSAAEQKKYMEEFKMPWPAVPYDSKERETLAKKYDIVGIPSLIVLDSKNNVVSTQGVVQVMQNPSGAIAEWAKKAK